jgi:hypothetical protein
MQGLESSLRSPAAARLPDVIINSLFSRRAPDARLIVEVKGTTCNGRLVVANTCFARLIETDEKTARKSVRLQQIKKEEKRAAFSTRSGGGILIGENVAHVVGVSFH